MARLVYLLCIVSQVNGRSDVAVSRRQSSRPAALVDESEDTATLEHGIAEARRLVRPRGDGPRRRAALRRRSWLTGSRSWSRLISSRSASTASWPRQSSHGLRAPRYWQLIALVDKRDPRPAVRGSYTVGTSSRPSRCRPHSCQSLRERGIKQISSPQGHAGLRRDSARG